MSRAAFKVISLLVASCNAQRGRGGSGGLGDISSKDMSKLANSFFDVMETASDRLLPENTPTMESLMTGASSASGIRGVNFPLSVIGANDGGFPGFSGATTSFLSSSPRMTQPAGNFLGASTLGSAMPNLSSGRTSALASRTSANPFQQGSFGGSGAASLSNPFSSANSASTSVLPTTLNRALPSVGSFGGTSSLFGASSQRASPTLFGGSSSPFGASSQRASPTLFGGSSSPFGSLGGSAAPPFGATSNPSSASNPLSDQVLISSASSSSLEDVNLAQTLDKWLLALNFGHKAEWVDVFSKDGEFYGPEFHAVGKKELRSLWSSMFSTHPKLFSPGTYHFGGTFNCIGLSATTAACESNFFSLRAKQNKVMASGVFSDQLVKGNGGWKIASRVMKLDASYWAEDILEQSDATDSAQEIWTAPVSDLDTADIAIGSEETIVRIRHAVDLFWFLVNNELKTIYLDLFDPSIPQQGFEELYEGITGHQGHQGYGLQTLVNLVGPSTASVTHSFVVMSSRKDQLAIVNSGFSKDTLILVDGEWRFQSRQVFVEQAVAVPPPQTAAEGARYAINALSQDTAARHWLVRRSANRLMMQLDAQDNQLAVKAFTPNAGFVLNGAVNKNILESIERYQTTILRGRIRSFLSGITSYGEGGVDISFLGMDTVLPRPAISGMFLAETNNEIEPLFSYLRLFMDPSRPAPAPVCAPSTSRTPESLPDRSFSGGAMIYCDSVLGESCPDTTPCNANHLQCFSDGSDGFTCLCGSQPAPAAVSASASSKMGTTSRGARSGGYCDSTSLVRQFCPDGTPCSSDYLDCSTRGPTQCLCASISVMSGMRAMELVDISQDEPCMDKIANCALHVKNYPCSGHIITQNCPESCGLCTRNSGPWSGR